MTPQLRARFGEFLGGYRHTALLYVAAKLRLADLISQGLCEAGDLARRLAVDEDALHRVLRGLAAMEVLREEANGSFALTELGGALLSSTGGSFRELALLAGEEYLPAWGGLLHSVRTGQAAFAHAFGMSAWEHRWQNPELGAAFDAALFEETSTFARSLSEAYDFSRVREVVDIGGGRGGLLPALLAAHPSLRGVLFDRPHVVAEAGPFFEGSPFAERLRTVGGDFFSAIPPGADLYLLKSVLHDWDDEACRSILGTCRRAMGAAERLLIIERALPPRAADDPATIMLDLHMLAMHGGRERSLGDYRRLAGEAGLEGCGTFPLGGSFQIMEFKPKTANGR